jgi:hypothetical protein
LLAPLHGRGKGVDDRLDPRLDRCGVLAPQLEEVPARQSPAAALADVDLDHPAGELRLLQVGPDPAQSVAVGIEEEAAVPAADQVDELGDRRLGLAVAAAPGDVGEEGVGSAGADHLLALLAADSPERNQVRVAFRELRQRGRRRQQGPRAHDVLRDAVGVRRLQKAGDLSGREDHAPGRTVKAGGEAAVEAAPPQRVVGAEEDDVADP